MRFEVLTIGALLLACLQSAGAENARTTPSMAKVSGATFESVLPIAPGQTKATVKSFKMDVAPVTNAEFAAFVAKYPEWRRDRVLKLFADEGYLGHWSHAQNPEASIARQPVTRVSWYAARAYCESVGKRLPTWYEWEWAAAAGAKSVDARNDPAWKQQILAWYSRPSGALPSVGRTPANLYGIRDLHGVIWEWIDDFNGMLVSSDSRSAADSNVARFCGTGALTMENKDQYAILMRIAMLSSLQAKYTTASLGFRCVSDDDNGAR